MKNTKLHPRKNIAILVGIISGIISGIVKFGWEVPFPPRTPIRNATNPPQQLLEQLGMSSETSHMVYYFSETPLPIMSFIIHFAFAIAIAILYCMLAEYYPKIKLWQGTIFGIVVWFVFHIVLMPLFGTVPAAWDQPFDEHFSEFFGHAFWMWIVELTRRDLRNRITHEPDSEFTVNASTLR